MPHPFSTLDLAVRLRRDAEATCLSEYADLMRRAAEELETFVALQIQPWIGANGASIR
jgi:hypothetical protein